MQGQHELVGTAVIWLCSTEMLSEASPPPKGRKSPGTPHVLNKPILPLTHPDGHKGSGCKQTHTHRQTQGLKQLLFSSPLQRSASAEFAEIQPGIAGGFVVWGPRKITCSSSWAGTGQEWGSLTAVWGKRGFSSHCFKAFRSQRSISIDYP